MFDKTKKQTWLQISVDGVKIPQGICLESIDLSKRHITDEMREAVRKLIEQEDSNIEVSFTVIPAHTTAS